MKLRTTGDLANATEFRLRRLRLPATLVAATALLLTTLITGSSAGVSNYQGTLYFDGAPSSVVGTSFQITTTAGPAAPVAPVATAGAMNSGTVPAGNYLYLAVAPSGGGRTAGPVSNQVSIPANGSASLANVPLGSLVYRVLVAAFPSPTSYKLVSPAGGTAAVPFIDDGSVASSELLPEADNRGPLGGTGYIAFTPGVAWTATTTGNSTYAATASAPGSCTGWIVDGSGGMSFAAGTWTFQAKVKSGAIGAFAGTANLTAAMYKVDAAGAVLSTVIPPTDGAANMINAGGTANTVSVSATTAAATTLDTGEHLCVQFWRHQTVAYSGGSAAGRMLSLLAYDPANQITAHPAPNNFATAALSSPANGFHTSAVPALGATYSDAEGDPGTLTMKLCSDAACSSQLDTSGALAATNGATLNWTPSVALADGTYYWQARAQDTTGLPSNWTATRSFVVDTAAPTTSISSKPAALSNAASGTFSFSASEPVTGFQCRVDAGSFAGCSSPSGYGPLADGPHTFDVKATADLAGNAGTTASYAWSIDTVPPDTSFTSQPAALSNSASPSFGLSSTQGTAFECKLDAAAFAACTSPASYSGLADGSHTFQARAVDPSGNSDPSPASYTWTIDATAPDTTIGPSEPGALTIATGATFDFASTESPATFQCSLDGAAFASCSTPKTYSALADGSHTFQVRSTDAAANTDTSPASYTWTVDTTPPSTSIGSTVPAAHTSSSTATFDLVSNEAGSTFECRLDGGVYAPCTTPVTYSAVADGNHTFAVRATDPAGNVDTSPASYSWQIDNVAPTATLTAPADALVTNALPSLRATFGDATAGGDTGTVDFQICSSPAAAGSACAPVVQSATSSSVSSGGGATVAPAALADGTYYWQARARDAAGNLSGWSATRSFQLDTGIPLVPALGAPAEGAWANTIKLEATFSKPAFAGTGVVDFRLCSDPLCLSSVRSGNTESLVNGQLGTWSPSSLPVDGLYYWQSRARDSVGNISAWSPVRSLHLDRVAPGKPLNFNGVVAGDGLTLRWAAPSGDVANYVVFVNGVPWKNFGSTEFEAKLGPFDANDTRTFSVVATDLADNIGAMSQVLVGVPNVVGMNWADAVGAATSRGLVLSHDSTLFGAIPMVVSGQQPPAPALAERGSSVAVTMAPTDDAPLAVRVRPGSFACPAGSVLRLRIDLSAAASVGSRLLTTHGRLLKRTALGQLHAGSSNVKVRLPRTLQSGAYRLLLDASGTAGKAHAVVRVKVGSQACRAR